jgi:hypothetical protein
VLGVCSPHLLSVSEGSVIALRSSIEQEIISVTRLSDDYVTCSHTVFHTIVYTKYVTQHIRAHKT